MAAKMKLSDIDILKLFSTPDFAELLSGFSKREYARKELISSPYDDKDSIFIVQSGRLRVYLCYEDREFTLALLEAGDIFSTHAPTYAEAMENSVILAADTRSFQQKIIEHPEITGTVVKVLGELLNNSINIIEGLVFKDVKQRLYDFLLNAVAERGKEHSDGVIIELGLSTEDIALLIGTTRQTISMLMNELIKAGHIRRLDRQNILIINSEILSSLQQGS
nr:Crp/Fnr family transcriptional regulator [uncultured Desulfuromonas sp.]